MVFHGKDNISEYLGLVICDLKNKMPKSIKTHIGKEKRGPFYSKEGWERWADTNIYVSSRIIVTVFRGEQKIFILIISA